MAAKKTTKKKTSARTRKPKDLGTVPGVAEARDKRSSRTKKPAPDMAEVMVGTAAADAVDAKTKTTQSHVKLCHHLSREATNRLACARLETATHGAIKHDCERVVELTDLIREEAEAALEALAR